MMRRFSTTSAFALVVIAASVVAPTGAMAQSQTAAEKAYMLTLTCNVVAAYFNDEPMYAQIRQATDKMAKSLNYSQRRVAHDQITMSSVLGDGLRSDKSLMDRHRAVCRRYGLAS